VAADSGTKISCSQFYLFSEPETAPQMSPDLPPLMELAPAISISLWVLSSRQRCVSLSAIP
ncbi:hypothetical protein ACLD3S_21795, partial [Salmonella sp. 741265086_PSA]|uniref:hypothetical protein n=1 Tax=Salmonella sp. 741265086_PSA TaxID=3389009 RepID=UPI0039804886